MFCRLAAAVKLPLQLSAARWQQAVCSEMGGSLIKSNLCDCSFCLIVLLAGMYALEKGQLYIKSCLYVNPGSSDLQKQIPIRFSRILPIQCKLWETASLLRQQYAVFDFSVIQFSLQQQLGDTMQKGPVLQLIVRRPLLIDWLVQVIFSADKTNLRKWSNNMCEGSLQSAGGWQPAAGNCMKLGKGRSCSTPPSLPG